MTSEIGDVTTEVSPKKRLFLHRCHVRQHKRFSWYPRQLLRAATQVDLGFYEAWRNERVFSDTADMHFVRAVTHLLQWALEETSILETFDRPAQRKAEDLAFQGAMAFRKGKHQEAKAFYLAAAVHYRRLNRDVSNQQLRGVFATATTYCFLHAKQTRRARYAANEFLAGPKLLPEHEQELRDVLVKIRYSRIANARAAVEELERVKAELQLAVSLHDVAVRQRDAAWRALDQAEATTSPNTRGQSS